MRKISAGASSIPAQFTSLSFAIFKWEEGRKI